LVEQALVPTTTPPRLTGNWLSRLVAGEGDGRFGGHNGMEMT